MALVGIELLTLVPETDALTTRPPPVSALSYLPKRTGLSHFIIAMFLDS